MVLLRHQRVHVHIHVWKIHMIPLLNNAIHVNHICTKLHMKKVVVDANMIVQRDNWQMIIMFV